MLARVRLEVAYDGAEFHGFAAQPGVKTVGGTLETTIRRVAGHDVRLTCAGRTDTGVHAWGQVVSFDLPAEGLEVAKLQHAVNQMCGPAIVVRAATVAPADFDARFSAQRRRYRYTVLNRDVPDPFLAATSWWVPLSLDRHALQAASDPLIGEHDFSSFCRKVKHPVGEQPPSMVRRVYDAHWDDEADGILRFWIEANAFCHQMVRSVVGTLVEAGHGKRHAGDILAILRARDRATAGTVAPPHGLCLWEVTYPE